MGRPSSQGYPGCVRGLVVIYACSACGHRPQVVSDAPPVLEDVHRIGRFDAQSRFAWPGTQIATTFQGTTIAVDLEDGGQDWFDIVVDGTATPLHLDAGRKTYTLANGLTDGKHELVIARRTESSFGPTTFHGFVGATLVATPVPAHMIEMIGDSITAGYGVLGAGPTCAFSAATEAETHAWGALAAHDLGAVHAAIAYSGFGVWRNYDGTTTTPLPGVYQRTIADDPQSTWTFAYRPDVIVIDLGTNDFAAGDPGQSFVDAYRAFVQMLRTRFPDVPILLATSPMLTGANRTMLRGYLDSVVQALADPHVQIVEIAEQLAADGYGCDYHPDETTQRKMADTLVPAIRAATGW